MNKSIFIILFSLLLIGSCNLDSKEKAKKNSHQNKEAFEKKIGEFPIGKYDIVGTKKSLNMYNIPYSLEIEPKVVENKNRLSYEILLKSKKDTIFREGITIERIYSKIKENLHFIEKVDTNSFLDSFRLMKVSFHGIRTKNIYFEAALKSMNGKDIFLLFQIDYLKEPGTLFINRLKDDE